MCHHQSVTVPKMLNDTDTGTFFSTKFFPIPQKIWYPQSSHLLEISWSSSWSSSSSSSSSSFSSSSHLLEIGGVPKHWEWRQWTNARYWWGRPGQLWWSIDEVDLAHNYHHFCQHNLILMNEVDQSEYHHRFCHHNWSFKRTKLSYWCLSSLDFVIHQCYHHLQYNQLHGSYFEKLSNVWATLDFSHQQPIIRITIANRPVQWFCSIFWNGQVESTSAKVRLNKSIIF